MKKIDGKLVITRNCFYLNLCADFILYRSQVMLSFFTSVFPEGGKLRLKLPQQH
jgi:hypothetical protein